MLACWLVLAPGWALELSLKDALEVAFTQNLELQKARLELERAERLLVQVQGNYDPDLSVGIFWGGDISPSNDVDENDVVTSGSACWSIGLQQELPGGGSASLSWQADQSQSDSALEKTSVTTNTWAGVSLSQPLLSGAGPVSWEDRTRARLGLDQHLLAWRRAQENLLVEVSGAYWNLVSSGQGLDLAGRSVEVARSQLEDTKERLEEGHAGSGDVLQVQRALGVALQAEVVATADLEAAQSQLARLLGRDLSRDEPLVPTELPQVPELEPAVEASLQQARARNVPWLLAGLRAQEARLDRQVAMNSALPALDLVGSMGFSGNSTVASDARSQSLQGSYPSWAVGLDLSLPLPARSPRSTASRARLAEQSALLGLEAAEQDLVLRVQNGVRAVRRDRSRVALSEQTVEAAQAALDADWELLQEGQGSTRDAIRSLENLDAAQLVLLQVQIDLQQSLLELRRIEGSLVD